MKYIEELIPGDCFSFNGSIYIVTTDFKRDSRSTIDLKTGQPKWILFDKTVEKVSIYALDDDTNFYPINPEPANANLKN